VASAAETALAVDCVGRRLNLAARASRQVLDAHLAPEGMTSSGFLVLMVLRHHGPLIQRALAEWLGIEGPTLTRQLEKLQRKRLVSRQPDGADRRASLVELTPTGRERPGQIEAIVGNASLEVTARLTATQVQQLSNLLDLLAGSRPMAGAITGWP
jgi:MarR family transcriptional regulator for hemolysin